MSRIYIAFYVIATLCERTRVKESTTVITATSEVDDEYVCMYIHTLARAVINVKSRITEIT